MDKKLNINFKVEWEKVWGKAAGPSYEVIFWSDKDAELLVFEHFPEYYDLWSHLVINVEKWDWFRYMLIYVHGGFYFDNDIIPTDIISPGEFYEHINVTKKITQVFDENISKYLHTLIIFCIPW